MHLFIPHESLPIIFSLSAFLSERRILQYGQMSMSSEATEGDQSVTKAAMFEAGGDQGLLNLMTDDTVFYVGGYPSTFKVRAQRNVCSCQCVFLQ